MKDHRTSWTKITTANLGGPRPQVTPMQFSDDTRAVHPPSLAARSPALRSQLSPKPTSNSNAAPSALCDQIMSVQHLKTEAARHVDKHTNIIKSAMARYDAVSDFTFTPEQVFITSFMKSGTTLAQYMTYQLFVATGRVPSDPTGENFNDISAVVPLIENRTPSGCLRSVNAYEPAVWKTHANAFEFDKSSPTAGRFLYCVRDGLKVAPSFVDFIIDWISDEPIVDDALRDEFYQQFFQSWFLGLERLDDGAVRRVERDVGWWFQHVKGWLEAPKENILFLIYEDVVADIGLAVRNIAKFLDIEVTDEQVAWVLNKCDREAMANDPRFQDILVSNVMGWESTNSMRVKSANAKGFKQVALWKESVDMYCEMFYDAFGVRTYEELVAILRERNEKQLRK